MRELLAKKASRANSYQVVAHVANDTDKYHELVEIVKENSKPYSEKAAWAINHCFENGTGFFDDYFEDFAQILADSCYSDSIKRNVVRIFQFKEIPINLQGSVINSCFHLLQKKETAIAVKAFSMGVLENMVKLYPELKNELAVSIKEILPTASAGIKNRGHRILNRLSSN